MTTRTDATAIDLDALRAGLDGRVVTPGDPEYDEMRVVVAGARRRATGRHRPPDECPGRGPRGHHGA